MGKHDFSEFGGPATFIVASGMPRMYHEQIPGARVTEVLREFNPNARDVYRDAPAVTLHKPRHAYLPGMGQCSEVLTAVPGFRPGNTPVDGFIWFPVSGVGTPSMRTLKRPASVS